MKLSGGELAGAALAALLPVGVVLSDRYAGGRNLLNGSGGTGFLGDALDAPVAALLATGLAAIGAVGVLSGHPGPGGLFKGMLVGGGAMAVAAWIVTRQREVEAEKAIAARQAASAAQLAQMNAQFPGLIPKDVTP